MVIKILITGTVMGPKIKLLSREEGERLAKRSTTIYSSIHKISSGSGITKKENYVLKSIIVFSFFSGTLIDHVLKTKSKTYIQIDRRRSKENSKLISYSEVEGGQNALGFMKCTVLTIN